MVHPVSITLTPLLDVRPLVGPSAGIVIRVTAVAVWMLSSAFAATLLVTVIVRQFTWDDNMLWTILLAPETFLSTNLVSLSSVIGIWLHRVTITILAFPISPRDLVQVANYVSNLAPVALSGEPLVGSEWSSVNPDSAIQPQFQVFEAIRFVVRIDVPPICSDEAFGVIG